MHNNKHKNTASLDLDNSVLHIRQIEETRHSKTFQQVSEIEIRLPKQNVNTELKYSIAGFVHPTQSQYTDTGPTCHATNLIMLASTKYSTTGPRASVVARPPSDLEVVGSNPGRVKPKTLKLILW